MGPTRIIEITDRNKTTLKFAANIAYLHRGRLWRWQELGCICCLEDESFARQTLQLEEDEAISECMEHGALEPVPYHNERKYTINIGGQIRTGSRSECATLYLPHRLTAEVRDQMIARLLGEAEEEERSATGAAEEDEHEVG